MRVSIAPEALIDSQVADSEVGDLFQRDVTISQQPSQDGGYDYSLIFKGGSLAPETAYGVMRVAAPYDGQFETPRDVIADWQEPDNHTTEAKERIVRHERLLGQNWHDFMISRPVFMEVVEAVPQLDINEQEVRPITEPDELASFAAAYLVNPNDAETALKILSNAGVDKKHTTAIWNSIRPFLVSPPRGSFSMDFHYRLGDNAQETADAIKQMLSELPKTVTKKVVNATVKPAIVLDSFGLKELDYNTGRYKTKLIIPSSFFGERYCVQAKRDEEGNVTAVPFAREGYTHKSGLWLIPEWDSFTEWEQNGTVRKTATLTNPAFNDSYGYGYRPMLLADRAVQRGSLRSAPTAPLVKPEIRWRTNADGNQREFVLDDEQREVQGRRIVRSGIFGVILAAAAQPDITRTWPERIHNQIMGVAQLPVLALIQREQLANGGLLARAEKLVSTISK
ncbi:hypothetical protein IPO96_03220 [Candidatus Saccharibacteria bacterium]|nr:MAG: hypothetical protein IPO96_03220 [Candidatus Saccharibacteria bacterium]